MADTKTMSIDLERVSRICSGAIFTPSDLDREQATALLARRIPYRAYEVPVDEFQSPACVPEGLQKNWLYSFHSLMFVDVLRREWTRTGREEYRDAYEWYLSFWLDRFSTPPQVLPTQREPGDFSWYDMSVARRTFILISSFRLQGPADRLAGHIRKHATALATDSYYAGIGNHALHQNNALLAAGLVLGDDQMVALALDRTAELLAKSVDAEGVSLEGSPGYQFLNAHWWFETVKLLDVCRDAHGRTLSVPDMRPFMRHCVTPDGHVVMLGDTAYGSPPTLDVMRGKFPGDFIEFLLADDRTCYALTQGKRGTPPDETLAVYQDGYVFSRNHWRLDDVATPPTHLSLRFGTRARHSHAHDDAGSITFYRGKERLIEDGGMFGYYGGASRSYVKSSWAHSGVVVPGRKYYQSATSRIICQGSFDAGNLASVQLGVLERTAWRRTVAHGRHRDIVMTQDVIAVGAKPDADATPEVWQLWQLGDECVVDSVSAARVEVSAATGKFVLLWLHPPDAIDVVRGQEQPLLGWRSTREGEIHPISTVRACFRRAKVKATVILVPVAHSMQLDRVELISSRYGNYDTRVTIAVGDEVWSVRFATHPEPTLSVAAAPRGAAD